MSLLTSLLIFGGIVLAASIFLLYLIKKNRDE